MEYRTCLDYASSRCPGVCCRIKKISLQGRLVLLREIREIARQYEFLAAGEPIREKYDAAVLQHEINKLYWDNFVQSIEGLSIDGQAATPKLLWSQGPDDLVQEILKVISSQAFLSDEQTKN